MKLKINSKNIIVSLFFLMLIAALAVSIFYLKEQKISFKNIKSQLESQISEYKNKLSDQHGKIVIYGDSRTGLDVHRQIVAAIYNLRPETIFNVGDLVEDGNVPEQWQAFNEIAKPLIANFNYFVAAGNHENESKLYYDNFAFPGNEKWYSLNLQKIHWTVINTNIDIMPGSEQYRWLEADLAEKRDNIGFTAVIMHEPILSSGKHAKDEEPYRASLAALFEKYGVDMVFAGHDHDYERSFNNGIYYFTCGAAGAPLYEKEFENAKSQKFLSSYNYCVVQNIEGKIHFNAYNEKSDSIDSLEIQ